MPCRAIAPTQSPAHYRSQASMGVCNPHALHARSGSDIHTCLEVTKNPRFFGARPGPGFLLGLCAVQPGGAATPGTPAGAPQEEPQHRLGQLAQRGGEFASKWQVQFRPHRGRRLRAAGKAGSGHGSCCGRCHTILWNFRLCVCPYVCAVCAVVRVLCICMLRE